VVCLNRESVTPVGMILVDDLLPLVHSVWKPFVQRFTDSEPAVAVKVSPVTLSMR
jgi:hypothetical protein